jgi:DNA-binding CsgD family transcriptional regulator
MSPDAQEKQAPSRRTAHTFGESTDSAEGERALALVALVHTSTEQQLYKCMLAEVASSETNVGSFTARGLMSHTRIYDHQKIKRALAGLRRKLCIEPVSASDDARRPSTETLYLVHSPVEVLARREAAGISTPRASAVSGEGRFCLAAERLAERYRLSLRQAQVVAFCARGLTNAEIGERLRIGEQTVKFHMRNILAIFGVRSRTQLVSSLLIRELGLEEESAFGD